MILMLAALAGSAVPTAAVVAAEIEAAPTRCDFHAWSKDRDPAGLNVRAAPRRDAAVVGRLPPPRDVDGEAIAVEFRVVGGGPGWLLIDKAEFGDYGTGARRVFDGRGWVAAGLVGVSVQDERVRRAAAEGAEIVDAPRELPDGTKEYLSLRRILACSGRWIEIEGAFRSDAAAQGRTARGWVTNLCGNQVTTCP